MDPRLEQSPPGAPETLTGSASQEGSRRLLRSQPRRLGFGQPRRARPRRSYANITIGSSNSTRKPELSTWLRIGTFYLAPTVGSDDGVTLFAVQRIQKGFRERPTSFDVPEIALESAGGQDAAQVGGIGLLIFAVDQLGEEGSETFKLGLHDGGVLFGLTRDVHPDFEGVSGRADGHDYLLGLLERF